MPERFPSASWFWRVRAQLTLLLVCGVVIVAAACTESFDGGGACPSLCPSKPSTFRDTTFEAVVLDTSVAGFPSLGLSPTLLLVNRPDTVVTAGVIRFDVLPTTFTPNKGTVSANITAIDSVYLKLPLDSTGRLGTLPVTLDVFDVDSSDADTSGVVLTKLLRPDRRIGSLTFTPSATGDSLRVPINAAKLLAKITAATRLRVGLKLSGSSGQLRVVAFRSGLGAPTLSFEPTSDDSIAPVTIAPSTTLSGVTDDVQLAFQVYGITLLGSKAPDATTLVVGGYPAYRTYLRFAVPTSITDSSTIVRAEVLLTQRPSTFASAADSVTIVPLVPTTTNVVSDLRRILDLAAPGVFASLDSARLVPRDSGLRAINVLRLARTWPSLPSTVPRAIAFRIGLEGGQPAELRFFSSEAAASLRPRLRITYLPRSEFAIP